VDARAISVGREDAVSVYRGVIKGKTVVIPPDAALAEGTIVEVRLAEAVTEAADGDAADQRVQAALVAVGLLERVQPLGARAGTGAADAATARTARLGDDHRRAAVGWRAGL
jgi:hypothetical protein